MGPQDRNDRTPAQAGRGSPSAFDAQQAATARSSTRRHLSFLIVWLVLIGALYFAFDHLLAPPRPTVSATGDLRIPRARDGHFHVPGTVNGAPVVFLVDTGASTVVVSHAFAERAGLSGGTPTVFQTANGALQGRVVRQVPVTAGPLSLSSASVGVGLVGGQEDRALLGQNFLSRFDVSITGDEMVIRRP